ncbi:hypothetical protein PsorP6_003714 [Peronosclerospora sorghi]|uniref:Uncharacterized protein n=1 Tax=Peronosclerospora sorghi TaxID=230839 RepID=A0ACC0VLL9_9STRA|nr:hypothetical protein PsorP6_003714 [Peronosclerospora sorghi]
MSSDTLTWLLTKNTSSFLIKRNGNEFAREKFNLLNRNCRKYSGLASAKAVDLSLADKKVTLTTKIAKVSKKLVKSENAVPLRKGARGGANTIRANISRNHYRRDLKKAALARWSRLSTVAKVENATGLSIACKRLLLPLAKRFMKRWTFCVEIALYLRPSLTASIRNNLPATSTQTRNSQQIGT